MKKIICALLLAMPWAAALGQSPGAVNISVVPASGRGPLNATLTWSTAPAAVTCDASDGWTGSKAASGTQALANVTATTKYTLLCQWPGGLGSALVSWTAPTTNDDGTALTDLAGFRVLFGTSASALSQSKAVGTVGATSTTVSALTPGAWFFAVRAVNAGGVESANSNVAQKTVVGPAPVTASGSATLTIDKVPSPPTNTTVVEVVAYSVVPDLQHFAFLRGPRAGSIRLGSACDESRVTADGYTAISRPSQVVPRPAPGAVLVARCG